MIVYHSEYHVSLDEKGRILIPSPLKIIMTDNNHTVWYLTRGFDSQLLLFPSQFWQILTDGLEKLPLLNPKAQFLRRHLIGGCVQLRPDSVFRFNIPGPFRKYAEILDTAVISGCGNYLELWNETKWDEFFKQPETRETLRTYLEELFPLQINPNSQSN